MAVKDHTLDRPIMEAAKKDFLENGFEKASMRRIAELAGVTHGALYTRAKSKDELFLQLVSPLIGRIRNAFESLRNEYFTKEDMTDPSSFINTMRKENETILEILFSDYESSRLLLVKNAGSSLEGFFGILVERKIAETLTFFEKRGVKGPDPGVLKLLIDAEFGMFREVIDEGYTLDRAREILARVLVYHEAGWRALLDI